MQEALENVEKLNIVQSEILKKSIINPFFGFLYDSTGLLNNLRFFSPEIKISKNFDIRQYSHDSSDNSFIKLLIELFPSQNGILSIDDENLESLSNYFKQRKPESIEFFSSAFVDILTNNNATIKYSDMFTDEKYENLKKLIFANDSIIAFKDIKLLKLVTIHSLIISLSENVSDLEYYLTSIIKKIENYESIEIYQIDDQIIPEIVKLDKEFNSFPYSSFKRPPSNEMIPIFDRERKDERNAFLEDRLFPDCADVLILNICNCLLFNPNTNTYFTNTLPRNSDILKFYTKHKNQFVITKEIRKEWSRVVQGLSDFDSKEDNGVYKTNIIVYKREKRNEIKSGLINMMNVIMKLFDINNSDFWKKFKGIESIKTRITKLFKTITPEFKNRTFSVKVLSNTISEFESMKRSDFTGKFNLIFTLPSGREITMVVEHMKFHAEMRFVSSLNQNYDTQIIANLSYDLPDTFPYSFIKKHISMSLRELYDSKNEMEKIFFNNKIETNNQKLNKLKIIFKLITDEQFELEGKNRIETVETLKFIVENILSTLPLSDKAIKIEFMPFLVYFEKLSNDDILNGWISSLEKKNSKISKIWGDRISAMDLKHIEIDCSMILTNKVSEMFDTLLKIKSLESLKLKDLPNKIENSLKYGVEGSSEDSFKNNFFYQIGRLNDLKKLDLSGNEMNSKVWIVLAESLEKLTKLEKLDLSDNHIGSFDSDNFLVEFSDIDTRDQSKDSHKLLPAIGKLQNLKDLNLSNNDICLLETVKLSNALENLKLEHLDLSGNSLCSEKDVALILSMIGKMSNLLSLNISNNNIGPNNAKSIAEGIVSLKNLRCLNCSNNNFSYLGAQSLSISLEKLEELIEVDFSFNSFGSDGSKIIVDSLKNSKKIQKFIFKNNLLRDEGAQNIAKSLSCFTNLEELDLSENLIKNNGVLSLFSEIQNFKNLNYLNLSLNSLQSDGAITLAKYIHNFQRLNILSLEDNKITTKGITALFESLIKLKGLEVLDLSNNLINSDILESLLKILDELKELKGLFLSINPIKKDIKQTIIEKLNNMENRIEHDISVDEVYIYDSDSDSDE